MQLSITTCIVALAAAAAALQITSPGDGAQVDLTKSNDVEWTSVNTDPSTFNLVLVNNAVFPTVQISVAQGVQTSAGSYSISGIKGVSAGNGYQINFVSTTNSGILAQSQQFTVVSSGSATSAGSTSSTSTGTSSSTSTSSTTWATSGNPSPTWVGSSPTGYTNSTSGSSGSGSGSGSSTTKSSTPSGTTAPKSGDASTLMPISVGAVSVLMGLFALIL